MSRLGEVGLPARARVLRRAVAAVKGDLRRITFSHISDVIALMETGPANGRLSLPEGVQVLREGEGLRITRSVKNGGVRPVSPRNHLPGPGPGAEQRIPEPGRNPVVARMDEIGLALKFSAVRSSDAPDIAGSGGKIGLFDMDALHFPLILRGVRPGDRFRPLGMTGAKKVKKHFIDSKIPASHRGRYPLLVSREDIIWVVGLRQNDPSKVTRSTRRLLKVELFLA